MCSKFAMLVGFEEHNESCIREELQSSECVHGGGIAYNLFNK